MSDTFPLLTGDPDPAGGSIADQADKVVAAHRELVGSFAGGMALLNATTHLQRTEALCLAAQAAVLTRMVAETDPERRLSWVPTLAAVQEPVTSAMAEWLRLHERVTGADTGAGGPPR